MLSIPALQRAAGNAAVARLLGEHRRATGAETRPPDSSVTVQRNLGVELEENDWRVTDLAGKRVGKSVPLVHRPFFQLQAEDSGEKESNIELVTNPPGVVDRDEWDAMTSGINVLVGELKGITTSGGSATSSLATPGKGDKGKDTEGEEGTNLEQSHEYGEKRGRHLEVGSEEEEEEEHEEDEEKEKEKEREEPRRRETVHGPRGGRAAYPTVELTGGEPGYLLRPSYGVSLDLQVTAGVPLACVPELFAELGAVAQLTAPEKDRVVKTAYELRQRWAARPSRREVTDTAQRDREQLLGLITLIRSYFEAGTEEKKRVLFLKAVTRVMARTDFARMFMMLPFEERRAINQDRDFWIAALTRNLDGRSYGSAADAPVLGQVADDPQESANPMRVTTSRRAWLNAMVSTIDRETEIPGRDLLTVKGRLAARKGDVKRPYGKAAAKLLAADVEEIRGWKKKEREFPGADAYREARYHPVANRIHRFPRTFEGIGQLVRQLESLFEGFGALGNAVDHVRYEGEEAPTEAVILEIRSPNSPWPQAMEEIYTIVDKAIRRWGPYTNELTDEGRERREEADSELLAVEERRRAWVLQAQARSEQAGIARLLRGSLRALPGLRNT